MNFITLKELKKMVPVASEFKRVPGLKKILEDGIEVILRKQMENHAEVVVYKNGYVSYHAHERYTVFALHNCTHYYYESQGNEHQTIPHNHFEDMEWHIRLVLEGEDRLVRNLEARESETFSYAADVNPEYNNEMEDPRINVMDFVLNKEFLRKARQADDKCIGHQITEKLLKALVMDQLHLFIVRLSDKRKVLEELRKTEDMQNPVYRAKSEIMSLTDKVGQMAKKREQLYADYVAGVVDSEDYQLIREDYSKQYDGLRAALQRAEAKKVEVEQQIREYLNMTSNLEEHLDDFGFDAQLVKSLVQRIEVSADKRIRIVFGFQDVFADLGKESAGK